MIPWKSSGVYPTYASLNEKASLSFSSVQLLLYTVNKTEGSQKITFDEASWGEAI